MRGSDPQLASSIESFTNPASLAAEETEAATIPAMESPLQAALPELGAAGSIVLGTAVKALQSLNTSMQRVGTELSARGPHEVAARRTQILRHTDWNAFIGRYVEEEAKRPRQGTESPPAQEYAAILKLLAASARQQSAAAPEAYITQVSAFNHSYDWLITHGLLRVVTNQPEMQNDREVPWRIDWINRWLARTDGTIQYVDHTRQRAIERPLNALAATANAIHLFKTNEDQSEITIPWGLAQALDQKWPQLVEAFYAADEAVIVANRVRQPSKLQIAGHALSEGIGIQNPEQWTAEALAIFPAWYTGGLKGVSYVRHMAESIFIMMLNQNPPPGQRWFVAGEYDNKRLRVAVRERSVALTTIGEDEEEIQVVMSRKAVPRSADAIRQTLRHEVTHHAHLLTIPLRWLEQWQRAIRIEQGSYFNVTEYVASCRQSIPEPDADREDLADSILLYKTDPVSLLWRAQLRFKTINDLFGDFDPSILRDTTNSSKQEIARRIDSYRQQSDTQYH